MKEVRAVVAAEIAPHADRFDAAGALPPSLVARLGALGWLGAAISPRWGGGGWDALSLGRLHAEVGRACAATRGLLTVQSMVATALERHASEELQRAYLPSLARGEHIAAFAISEPGVGSDVRSIETRAERCDGGFRLHGRKRWISYGQLAQVLLVFARLDEGMAAFVVEGGSEGLRRTPITGMLGMRAAHLAELELDGCFVPASRRADRGNLPISPAALDGLDMGRFSIAWGCAGIIDACTEASVQYARSRRQFGKPLIDHELVARHVTDMMTASRAARLLCEDAAAKRQADAPDAVLATLIAKYFGSTSALRVAADAVQVHGAYGCLSGGSGVERHMRDAKVMEIIEGSNEIQQVLIARHAAPQAHVKKASP